MTKKKQENHEPEAEAREASPETKAAETTPAFPYSASINEPQTVSLPVPPDVEVPVPSITSIEPTDCMLGDPDFTLYVSGENFFADSVIHFADHDEPTTLEADGTLSTGIKPSLWMDPVTVQVQIKNGPAISDPADFEFKPVARSGRK